MDPDITSHLMDIKENLSSMGQQIDGLSKAVLGNGQPGLRQEVDSLKQSRSWVIGAGAAIGAIWTFIEAFMHRR